MLYSYKGILIADSLKNDQAEDLANWMGVILGKEKVSKVMVSRHLPQTSHPAMVTLPDMAAAKQWLKVTRTGQFQDIASSKYQIFQPSLEINPRHELIKHLEGVRLVNAELAALVTHQLFDNAMMSAGLLHDPRTMLGRLNSLLEAALDSAKKEKGPKSSM
ncbi:Heat shock protein 75 kDa [Acropora cervicornis]|uniref:Heat shock protein 75 kDa n=1 Tax=Acropora cervicornis TaxID=6130 RepID=A0AAD9UW11_ACRCE|nr:Heat shock protein 75 kDa [Acropora cervicornis]